MIAELKPTPIQPVNRRYSRPANDAAVQRTIAALEANGMTVFHAATASEAKRIVLDLIAACRTLAAAVQGLPPLP